MIRPATIHDVPRIQEVIASHAELGKMLFKSLADLYEHLRDFAVYVDPQDDRNDGRGVPLGCVGLAIIWADLAEVRSLAVDEAARGRGIGTQLVDWCLAEGRRLGIRRVMSLTYERRFFERLGFDVVERDSLPLKVWTDCVRCPKNDQCDEIAMVRTLTDVPPLAVGLAPVPRGVSIPVLAGG